MRSDANPVTKMVLAIGSLSALLGRLAAAAVLTGTCLLAYLVMQQIERQGANDPQVQIAEDGALALADGATPGEVARGTTVDLAHSLATAVIVLDDDGNVLASNARLGDAVPVPPAGVAARRASRRCARSPRRHERSYQILTCMVGRAGQVAATCTRSRPCTRRPFSSPARS
ncbi:MAG: hypothetical protein HOQ12_13180, partial [Gemmatimonadaceae bacterium]|nr:hypothetical protein [Gemmatimonadaceae bacterium]